MKYEQHNFVVAVSAKAENLAARVNEVCEVKLALANHFIDSKYIFAIVGEDIVSNDLRLSAVINLVVSVVPHKNGIIERIDECHELKTAMAEVVGNISHRCIIADEDMMSDLAKAKIQYLPKEGNCDEQ